MTVIVYLQKASEECQHMNLFRIENHNEKKWKNIIMHQKIDKRYFIFIKPSEQNEYISLSWKRKAKANLESLERKRKDVNCKIT